jgi:hypothetical protein
MKKAWRQNVRAALCIQYRRQVWARVGWPWLQFVRIASGGLTQRAYLEEVERRGSGTVLKDGKDRADVDQSW